MTRQKVWPCDLVVKRPKFDVVKKVVNRVLYSWGLIFMAPWVLAGWVLFKTQASDMLFSGQSATHQWLISEVSAQARSLKFPTELRLHGEEDGELISLAYTLDPSLQKQADKLLASYRPDFGAIVVMDPNTGRIRAISSYERTPHFNENLALRASFPAASIFKMVTAAAAVDRHRTDPEDRIRYNGGNHTLYKRNVLSEQVNRWTRAVTLRDAFARSLNTAFGRLAIEKLVPKDLGDYAFRFGFNREIPGDLKFDPGYTEIPEDQGYELAEVASGFNRVTRMSPLQGALMAAAIANNGVMPKPRLVDYATKSDGQVIFESKPEMDLQVLSPEGVEKMKILMEETIVTGTSRKSFRQIRRDRKLQDLEIGGKTGSLQGTNPKGKTDWFVGYAIDENGDKLAIAAVTVHIDRWRVKSSELAQTLVKSHFKNSKNWIAKHP